jgi:hypothetical protein
MHRAHAETLDGGRVLTWPGKTPRALIARVAAAGAAVAHQRAQAPELAEVILEVPAWDRPRRLAADPGLATWPLAEHLVERGDDLAATDPAAAGESFDLAAEVLDRLAPSEVPAGLVGDLRGRLLAYRGDLLRRRGELAGAAEALAASRVVLRSGSGDPLEHARLLERMAALRLAEGCPADAARLAGVAAEVYSELEEPPGFNRAALLRADALRAAGRQAPARRPGSWGPGRRPAPRPEDRR